MDNNKEVKETKEEVKQVKEVKDKDLEQVVGGRYYVNLNDSQQKKLF